MLQQFLLPARNSNRHLVIDLRIDVHQGGWILIRILGSATVVSLENSGAYCNHTLWCKNTTIVRYLLCFLQGKSLLMAQAKKVHLLWCHPASKLLKSQLTFFNGQRDLHMYQQNSAWKFSHQTVLHLVPPSIPVDTVQVCDLCGSIFSVLLKANCIYLHVTELCTCAWELIRCYWSNHL